MRYKTESEARSAGEEALKLMKKGSWDVVVHYNGEKNYVVRLVSNNGAIEVVRNTPDTWFCNILFAPRDYSCGVDPWDTVKSAVAAYCRHNTYRIRDLVKLSEMCEAAIGDIWVGGTYNDIKDMRNGQ